MMSLTLHEVECELADNFCSKKLLTLSRVTWKPSTDLRMSPNFNSGLDLAAGLGSMF
jgi:hypothetical protein